MTLQRTYLLRHRLGFCRKSQFIRSCSVGFIDVNEEIGNALERRKPVVALESTIITHGMRYPHNLETALEVENIVRNVGATPATIAILNGRIKVGLDQKDLEMLARSQDDTCKISRRDIPFMISKKCSGGTTVSGTMLIANKVGIPLFVTGGIGGVHRNGETTMDVSADLTELGRTPVAVISAGVKSILDIGRTLEYLETEGVAVATYGSSRDFPAFYTRRSGFLAPYCLKTPGEAAEFIKALLDLNLRSGALIAVPIPEEHSFNERDIEKAISEGLEESRRKNVRGKDVTPFLLEHISRLTAGGSLKSNIALIKNNAKIGSEISVELAKLRETVARANSVETKVRGDLSVMRESAESFVKGEDNFEVVVVGGSNLDHVINLDSEIKTDGRMLFGKITQSGGGVGRNIADALGKLGAFPFFISAIGNDTFGENILKTISHMSHNGLIRCNNTTATCYVVCDNTGECRVLVGDMTIHQMITPENIEKHKEIILGSSLVVMDGNLSRDSMRYLLHLCKANGIPVWFEPTDIVEAKKAFSSDIINFPNFISPNIYELREILNAVSPSLTFEPSLDDAKAIDVCIERSKKLAEFVENVIVTLGKKGVLICRAGSRNDPLFDVEGTIKVKYRRNREPISCTLYTPEEIADNELVNVSGAGDCFASGFIAAMLRGENEESCVRFGFKCSLASLKCSATVPHSFQF